MPGIWQGGDTLTEIQDSGHRTRAAVGWAGTLVGTPGSEVPMRKPRAGWLVADYAGSGKGSGWSHGPGNQQHRDGP